ncbi:MAG: S-layer homology domain-containing protein [Dysosmobacter sp.]
MKKRVLASLLSVCLIVGLFPAALAADDPVCAFVCAVCPVQQQINDLLAQWEDGNIETLDEEDVKLFYDGVRAALEDYQALTEEEQAEITNADELFAVLNETPDTSDEGLCEHETEGDPCPICPVEEQIDAVLAQLGQAEELDEEGMLRLYEQALAAKRAFERLEWEEQAQIDADKIDMLLAFVETLDIQTLDDGDSTAVGMKIATAEIRAEGVSNQTLSDGNSFTIDFSKQFTLHIAVVSKLNLANKKVEITVPDGLTVVEYPIPERGGMAESVTPESIDELNSENSYGGYRPTNGTITYSLRNTAEKNSFNIVLAPDTVLWNRTKEQALKAPLEIKVYTDAQTYQTISATPTITGKYNDKEDDNRAIQTGPRLSRVGVKTGVPTAADQPFALRQIWINPDKDYIDMPQFFKKLEITIALPYYTKDGSSTYAELDHITWDPAGQSTRPNLLDPKNHKGEDGFNFTETKNDTNHTVTLTWTNLYLEYGQDYFTPYFKWKSDCDVTTTDAVKWGSNSIFNTGKSIPGCYEGKTPTTGAASAVGGTITWQDDSTWYLYNGDCTTFNFTAQAGESMSVKGKANNQPIYNNYAGDSDIIYYLGQFHVVNQGGTASVDKTVEFTYANNDKIGVTAQKIPATTGNTVEVWYQTTNTTGDTWTPYSGGTLTSSGGFVTFTTEMAGLGKDEYFTKIKANVGSYEKDYVGYVSSRDQDPTSGYATTFGKLLTAEAGNYTNFASMKMYDTGSEGNTAIPVYYTVKVTSAEGEIPLAMEQAYKEGTLQRVPILSKTSATAGDTITFNGLLSSSAYPYSSNNVTTDQEIYIRLPEKITVNNLKLYQEVGRMADKVFLLDAVTETVQKPTRTEITAFKELTSAEAGYKLYKITFTDKDNPAKVGWFTDGLGQYQIGISFDMEIAKDADAMTLDMRDCVRFKSASLASTSNNGTLAQYQVMDNGVRYSTFNVNAKGTKLSVVAARLGLTFTFGARMTEKGSEAEFDATKYSNFEVDKNTVYLKDADHVVDMLFTLKNETGREFSEEDAHAFYYFIPVPEKDDFWDSHMQDQPFEFHMSLTRAPELRGTSAEHILVTYATDIESTAAAGTDKHYSNTAQYKTEEQLLAGCTTDEAKAEKWKEVKMIRIAAKPEITSIPKNAALQVNMRLEPMFNENADLVGSEINFGPCGVSPYSVGNTLNQGHNPLPRIQVEFQTGIIAGKIFIDKNFNGTYDEGTDALYQGNVTVGANHSNGNENCTEGDAAHKTTTQNGTFKFTGRRADTYHVTVTNPGDSTDANGENPLKFSLPESGGKFSLDTGRNTATASVVLDMNKKPNDIEDAGSLLIGFQQPHTVTFSVPYGQGGTTTKVWHSEKLVAVPTVTANEGYRFTGNWTDGTNTYTADQLKEVAISSDRTFTAEVKKLYSVKYDGNGNTAGTVPSTTQHIEGEKVSPDYIGTENLKKGEKTIFVGWSKDEAITEVLPANAEQTTIDKIISTDAHTMPAANVTLYAVYAVDANGNGKPDYNDDSVHVRYHGNNNVREDILCPHHHVAGATAQLSTNGTVSGKRLGHDKPASAASGEVTSHTFTFTDKTTGNAHIFIGWSTSPILDTIIKTKADYDGLASSIVTEVTMEKAKNDGGNADADGNTNVYAVWAADRNGNKTADYLEEYTLTYDGNARQNGTVNGTPTDNTIYIPGDKVTLSKTKPTHSGVDNKAIVFIGWTEAQTNAIFSRADIAPATVTEVTFGSDNKTVYAAWGYDENGNGTADVLETYTLIYNLNGGSGTVPEKKTDIPKNTEIKLTTERGFTRNTDVFVGWSVDKREAALTAETKQEDLEKFLITGTTYRIGTEDVTLYAVWAVDSNGDGIPDYRTTYTVAYDLNGGVGAEGVNYDPANVKPNGKVTVNAAPTRSGHTFNGWKAADGTVHQPGTELTVTADLTLTAQWTSNGSGGGGGGGGSSVLNTDDHYSYIIGYKDGTLRPYGTITRGEVATIFFRLLTDEARDEYWDQDSGYSDCGPDLWCNNAISTLSNMGIIDGFQDGTFRPYAKITRAQFAKIAVGFFETTTRKYQGYYSDVPENAWFTDYVEAASRVGLIQGFEDGTFRPNVNITRAQACVIVNRALNRKPDEDHLLPERKMLTWSDNNPGDWFYADMQEATNSHDYTWLSKGSEKKYMEEWTKKLEQRDWAAFEHAWSTAHSAPGGEVAK